MTPLLPLLLLAYGDVSAPTGATLQTAASADDEQREEAPEDADPLEGLEDDLVPLYESPDGGGEELDALEEDLNELEDDLEELDALDVLEEDLAELEGEDSPAPGGFRPRLRSFKGFGSSELKSYWKDRGTTKRDEQLLLEMRIESEWELAPRLSAMFRPRFVIDALDNELLRYEPLDLYVSYDTPHWDVRAGQFVENWGIADTFNPVDVLNRRDLGTDFLDLERLGELGVRTRYHFDGNETFGEPTLALYVMPVWRKTVFPTEANRFSFSQTPFELQEDEDVPPPGGESVFLAMRAQHTLNTGPANADVQYVVSRGPERFPFLAASPQPDGTVDLLPEYYGTWTAGGGVRAVPNADVWSEFTFKLEIVYKAPYRVRNDTPEELPDEFVQYVIGLDRLFPNLLSQQDQLTLTVEYVGEEGADDFTSEFRPFQSDIVLRAFWEAGDFRRTSVELRGLIDLDNGETIIEGIYEQQIRSIHDDLKLQLAVQYFDRDRDEGLFSFFPNNSNVRVQLRFDF